jgi:hypothetical protein
MFLNCMIEDNIVIHYYELIFNFQIVSISFFVYLFETQVISNLLCTYIYIYLIRITPQKYSDIYIPKSKGTNMF